MTAQKDCWTSPENFSRQNGRILRGRLKSTMCLNSLVAGLSATKTPDEVRFIVFDPKCVEYIDLVELPHLIMPPVTSVQKMMEVVHWLESEVDQRLQIFASVRCRSISQFNSRKREEEDAETLPIILCCCRETERNRRTRLDVARRLRGDFRAKRQFLYVTTPLPLRMTPIT